MAEKLFGFGFGFLIRLLRGDLSRTLLLSAGAMMLLAAAVEVWGKRRYQAWKRAEGGAYAAAHDGRSRSLLIDSLLSMAGSLVVWGGIYGLLALAKRTFPSWGWPEETVANSALAWLSLLVAYSIIIGVGCLHLLSIGRRLSLSPFWLTFGTVWMLLVTCVFLRGYPLESLHMAAYALCGFISAAGTLLLWGLRDAEADPESQPAEDREAVNN